MFSVLSSFLFSAFTEAENHPRVDHLFALVLQRALLSEEMLKRGTRQTEFIEPCLDLLDGVRTLTMPEETKVLQFINGCIFSRKSWAAVLANVQVLRFD